MRKLCLLLLLCCTLGVGVSQARIVYVNAAASGSNNGTSWANAYNNLSTALANTLNNDTLWIAGGTYVPSNLATRDASFLFDQNRNLWLFGGFAGTETSLSQRNPAANPTILSGDRGTVGSNTDNSYNVVVFSTPTSVATRLYDLIIEGGNADGGSGRQLSGGGFTVFGSNATVAELHNCEIRNNRAQASGGFSQRTSGTVSLFNCWLHDNTATNAYSSFGADIGTINLVNTVIDARRDVNSTQVVLQVETASATLRLLYCTILLANNQSALNGFTQGASITFNQCVVTGGAAPPINTNASTRQNITITNSYVQGWGAPQASRVATNSTGFGGVYPFSSPTGTTLADFTPIACLGSVINRGQTATALATNFPAVPANDILGNTRLSADTTDLGAIEFQGPRTPETLVLPRFTASNDTTVCALSSLTFTAPTVSSAFGPVTYRWKLYSPNAGGNYNLSNTQTVNYTQIQSNDDGGQLFYEVVTPCGVYSSDSLTINVLNGFLSINQTLRFDSTACAGNTIRFRGDITTGPIPAGTIYWLRSYVNGQGQTVIDTIDSRPSVSNQGTYTYDAVMSDVPSTSYQYYMAYAGPCQNIQFPKYNITVRPNPAFTVPLAQVGNSLVTDNNLNCIYNWYLNGSLVATTDCDSDTSWYRFAPTQEGTYTVGVQTECRGTVLSDPINFTFGSTSINASQLLPALSIAPNPAADFVRVLGLTAPADFRLVNALGQQVLDGSLGADGLLTLPATLSTGLYSLHVSGHSAVRLLIAR